MDISQKPKLKKQKSKGWSQDVWFCSEHFLVIIYSQNQTAQGNLQSVTVICQSS